MASHKFSTKLLLGVFLGVNLLLGGFFIINNSSEKNPIHTSQPNPQVLGSYQWNWTATAPITELALSLDGNILVASSNSTMYVFSTAIATPIWTYTPGVEITSIALSGNGNRIVLGCSEKMFVFNTQSATPLFEWNIGISNLYGVDISNNGNNIISIDNTSTLNFFNLSQTIYSIPQWNASLGSGAIKNIAISGDGSRIVVGSPDMNLTCFNSDSNTPYWAIENYSSAVDISYDGTFIASTSSVYTYRYSGNSDLNASYLMMDTAPYVNIADDGNYIVSSTAGGYVNLYNFTEPLRVWELPTGGTSHDAKISANGNNIIAAITQLENYTYYFNNTSSLPENISIFDSVVNKVAISGTGSSIALGLENGKISFIGSPNTPDASVLSSDFNPSNPSTTITFNWTSSINADNYTFYRYNTPITGINGSLVSLGDGLTNKSMMVTQENNTVNYYCVVANNQLGSTLSNIIVIQMNISSSTNNSDTTTDPTMNFDQILSLFKELSFRNPAIYILLAALFYGVYKTLTGKKQKSFKNKKSYAKFGTDNSS